jgi:hypothetical protein
MSTELAKKNRQDINPAGGPLLPAIIAQAGDHAAKSRWMKSSES